jgi:AcrR family transcriptional regulator
MARIDIDKRDKILRVAETLVSARRFHEITLDEVAQQAAVGKGTIYRYFEDKEDLFLQVALSGFDELCQVVESGCDDGVPFERQLVHICERISEFFERRRPWFQLIQSEAARMRHGSGELRQRWLARRRRLVAAVAQVLARGVDHGAVRDDIPPAMLAHVLLGLLRTRVMDLVESPELPDDHALLVGLFLRGCAVSEARGVA